MTLPTATATAEREAVGRGDEGESPGTASNKKRFGEVEDQNGDSCGPFKHVVDHAAVTGRLRLAAPLFYSLKRSCVVCAMGSTQVESARGLERERQRRRQRHG